MQDRLISAIQHIKKARDIINIYLHKKAAYVSETLGTYVFSNDCNRNAQLQAVLGHFTEDETEPNLRTMIADEEDCNSKNLAVCIEKLKIILVPEKHVPPPKPDLKMVITSCCELLQQAHQELILYEIAHDALRYIEVIRDQIKSFTSAWLKQHKFLDLLTHCQLSKLQAAMYTTSQHSNEELTLTDILNDYGNELLNSDNIASIIDNLKSALKMKNPSNQALDIKIAIDWAIRELKEIEKILEVFDTLDNSNEELSDDAGGELEDELDKKPVADKVDDQKKITATNNLAFKKDKKEYSDYSSSCLTFSRPSDTHTPDDSTSVATAIRQADPGTRPFI